MSGAATEGIPDSHEFFTFADLMTKWSCTENDLAYLVVQGDLKPSVWYEGLIPITEWDIDEETGQMSPDRATSDAEVTYSLESVGWRYMQVPVQLGPFDCAFIFASRERDPAWPVSMDYIPNFHWYYLPIALSMTAIKESCVFLATEVNFFEQLIAPATSVTAH